MCIRDRSWITGVVACQSAITLATLAAPAARPLPRARRQPDIGSLTCRGGRCRPSTGLATTRRTT
eukprot:12949096-Alexandrium_andersonii.AAC.1